MVGVGVGVGVHNGDIGEWGDFHPEKEVQGRPKKTKF